MQSMGFNINFDAPGDMGFLSEALHLWQPTWVLGMTTGDGMNDQAWHAFNIVRSYGGNFIFRPFEYGEGDLWNRLTVNEQIARMHRWSAGQKLYINVGNEPRPPKNEIQYSTQAIEDLPSPTASAVSPYKLSAQSARKAGSWYAELIDRCPDEGLFFAGPSFATGNYEQDELHWWDDMWWAFIGTQDSKVDGIHTNIYAVHEYDFGLPFINTAGGNPQALVNREILIDKHISDDYNMFDKPTPEEVLIEKSSENWLLYRSWWGVEHMRGLLNNPNWSNISIVRTEGILDRPPHISVAYPHVVEQVDSWAGESVSGVISARKYLHELGKRIGWTAEHVAAASMGWVDYVDAHSDGVYLGTTIFSWTDNHNWPEQWAQKFGIQKWPELVRYYPIFHKQYIEPRIAGGGPLPPPSVPDPAPEVPDKWDPEAWEELVTSWQMLAAMVETQQHVINGLKDRVSVLEKGKVDKNTLLKYVTLEGLIPAIIKALTPFRSNSR